jgi:hypothetical protein
MPRTKSKIKLTSARRAKTPRKDLFNIGKSRIAIHSDLDEEIELRSVTPAKTPEVKRKKDSLSKTLITPEKQFEAWKAKKQPEQTKQELMPMLKTLPLIQWGGRISVNNATHTLVNTCPIGNAFCIVTAS